MTIDDEVRRATKLLEALIQVAGESQEGLERRLDASPGYLGRLLAGRVELKLRHILAILRILEIEPALFFQTLYQDAGPAVSPVGLDELRQRMELLGITERWEEETAPQKPEVRMDELEKLVQGAVQAALSQRKPEG